MRAIVELGDSKTIAVEDGERLAAIGVYFYINSDGPDGLAYRVEEFYYDLENIDADYYRMVVRIKAAAASIK